MADLFDLIIARYRTNADRAGSLILLAVKHADEKVGAALQGTSADLLRAALVFLHATFEDVLRTLGRHRLGRADEAALRAVQEAMGSRNQPYKFTLIELAGHRGKSVNDLVDETISVYLNTKSFSSTSEVSTYLRMMNLNEADFQDLYPYLSEMMKRRHEIVHTADLDRPDTHEPRILVADDAAALDVWVASLNLFVATLLSKLDAPDRANSADHLEFLETAKRELELRLKIRQELAARHGS